MNFVFVTRSPVFSIEDLYGRPSHDDEPEKVRLFCETWHFPYSSDFRSIFIYHEGEDPDPPGGASIKAYGNPFLLNTDAVLGDIQIVCTQDIQNAAVNGIDFPEVAERNANRFVDMSKLDPGDRDERVAAIGSVIARRERRQYVEARIFRTLVSGDVIRKLF